MIWSLTRERALDPLLGWVWPHCCPLCGCVNLNSDSLCTYCWSDLDILTEPKCEYCGCEVEGDAAKICADCYDSPRDWDWGQSVVHYSGKGKSMVLRLKNMRSENLAPIMAKLIYDETKAMFENVDLLIPMPLHWTKMMKRGFNQASLLAYALSRYSGVEVADNVLKRARATRAQSSLRNFEARKENLADALVLAHAERIKGKRVMLIDDVLTSGASLETASQTLRQGAPKSISVCAFARAGVSTR